MIEGRNETDETECEHWECNNIYTRCNDFWNCPNGEDELDCDILSYIDCPWNEHACVSPDKNELVCLPIEKANDKNVDCLGGTDEPMFCRKKYEHEHPDNFYCTKSGSAICINAEKLCNSHDDCDHGDDERFCSWYSEENDVQDYCHGSFPEGKSIVDELLCKILRGRNEYPFVFFSLVEPRGPYANPTRYIENREFTSSSLTGISHHDQLRCHRGLDLRVWLNDTNYLLTCFCPPNFYGNTCQYQNQRLTLSLLFQAFSDSWQTYFAIVISLIDDSDKRIIHSFEQFSYLSTRACGKKFHVSLFYSTRPKNLTKQYSIHTDIYEKFCLAYRGSLTYPIPFPFLPVHHLAYIVEIPRSSNHGEKCSNLRCDHGKCLKYFNKQTHATFCHCNPGWTGRYCTIPLNCTCSFDSLCIGISADNRSICICRPDRFGPRCLIDTACQTDDTSLCQNNGRCIFTDESPTTSICHCPKGFFGDQCESVDDSITLSFEKDIVLSQSIFIHFIEAVPKEFPKIATTFATVPIRKESLLIRWSQTFHIALVELSMNNYYLILIRKTHKRPSIIKKLIRAPDRCPHIREIFNQTLLKLHPLRRIKYYHTVCQNHSLNLSCFYDDVNLCFCYDFLGKRLANCLEFHKTGTFNCVGKSACENDGQCFQDDKSCPHQSICFCQPCFYGRLCQFHTSGFGLSLDAILSYHIQPSISIIYQSTVVKISLAITIIFMTFGLINSILSTITFKNKIIWKVGCGLYLFSSSIMTLLITISFGLKFWILLLSQIGIISNQLFLSIQCRSIDFLLRICLNIEQWLNACVAVERAYTAIKNTGFNQKKSKQIAKLVISMIITVNIGTSIHDPVYRDLIEEESDSDNEKRIWCIVRYPHHLQIFNSTMYIFHFFGPFIINLISTVTLIIIKTRQQLKLNSQQSFQTILRKQLRQHRQLLIAPVLLILLAIPRLVISFVSKCMKSADDSWLFLVGYFISFIPPMLTFFIFILPSTFYKTELFRVLVQYKINMQRRLHLVS